MSTQKNIPSATFSKTSKDRSISISKYNLKNFEKPYKYFSKSEQKIKKILNKYRSKDEKEIIKTYKYTEPITIENIIKNNKITLQVNRSPQQLPEGTPPSDDDRRKLSLSELQKNILKDIKLKDNYTSSSLIQEEDNNYYNILYKHIEVQKERYAKYEKDKADSASYVVMLYKVVGNPIIQYGALGAVAIGFNLLCIAPLTSPAIWLQLTNLLIPTISSIGSSSSIYLSVFTELIYTSGFFTLTDVTSLKELYKKMTDILKDPNAFNFEKNSVILTKIVQIIFSSTTKTKEEILQEISKLLRDNNIDGDITKNPFLNAFYEFNIYIWNTIYQKNIFNGESTLESIDTKWLTFASGFFNTPNGQFLLSTARLCCNMYAYVNTTRDLMDKYQNINSNIIFEGVWKYGINSASFNEIINTSTGGLFYEGDKLLTYIITQNAYVGNFVGIMGSTWTSPYNLINTFFPNFFTLVVGSTIKVTITSYGNSYFEKMKEEAKKSLPILQKTEEEQILEVENKIIKISNYKKEGITNEEIAELLNPTPEEPNNYKLPISRFLYSFKKNFKRFTQNPSLYISSYVNCMTIFKFLIYNYQKIFFGAFVVFQQNAVLLGLDNIQFRNFYYCNWIKSFLEATTLNTIIEFYFKMYYGSDEQISANLEIYKNKLASDIANDILLFHEQIQKKFFECKIGTTVGEYLSALNNMWIIQLMNTAIKITYYIAAAPLLTKTISDTLTPGSNVLKEIKIFDIIKDDEKMKKLAVFLNAKISNIIKAIGTTDAKQFFEQIADFADINKILLNTVIPYIDSDGYYELYGKQIEPKKNLKGNIIEFEKDKKKEERIILEYIDEEGNNKDNFRMITPDEIFKLLKIDKQKDASGNEFTIYDYFYSYYNKEFDDIQKNIPKNQQITFDKYLKDKYNELYRKINIEEAKDSAKNYTDIDIVQLALLSKVIQIQEEKKYYELTSKLDFENPPELLDKDKWLNWWNQKWFYEDYIRTEPRKIPEERDVSEQRWKLDITIRQNVMKNKLDSEDFKKMEYFINNSNEELEKQKAPLIKEREQLMKELEDLFKNNADKIKIQTELQDKTKQIIDIDDKIKNQVVINKFLESDNVMVPLKDFFKNENKLQIALPNHYGYRFTKVDALEFLDIQTILAHFMDVNETEYKIPIDLLESVKNLGEKYPFLLNRLSGVNIKYNTEYGEIIRALYKNGEISKEIFENPEKNLPLKYLAFDFQKFYNILKEKVVFSFESTESNDIFGFLKKILKIDDLCYNKNKNQFIYLDEYECNINNGIKEINNPGELECKVEFEKRNEEEKKHILEELLLRPDVIESLYQNKHNEFSEEEIKKKIDVFVKKNEVIISSLHDNLIDNVVAAYHDIIQDISEIKQASTNLYELNSSLNDKNKILEYIESIPEKTDITLRPEPSNKYIQDTTNIEDIVKQSETIKKEINEIEVKIVELKNKYKFLSDFIQIDGIASIEEFVNFLENIKRTYAMDPIVKRSIYDFFVMNNYEQVINFGKLEKEKHNIIENINNIKKNCQEGNYTLDEKMKEIFLKNIPKFPLKEFAIDTNIYKIEDYKNYINPGTLHDIEEFTKDISNYYDGANKQIENIKTGTLDKDNCKALIDFIEKFINVKYAFIKDVKYNIAIFNFKEVNDNFKKIEERIKINNGSFVKELITLQEEGKKLDYSIPSKIPEVPPEEKEVSIGNQPYKPQEGQPQPSQQPTVNPTQGPTVNPSQGPTVDPSKQQPKIEDVEKQVVAEKQQQDQAQKQEPGQKEAENEKLKNMLKNLFGGQDDNGIIGYIIDKLTNLFGKDLKNPNIKEKLEVKKSDTPEPIDKFTWCVNNAENWHMEGNNIVVNNNSISEAEIQLYGCSKPSSLEVIFDGLMTFTVNLLTTLLQLSTGTLSGICNLGAFVLPIIWICRLITLLSGLGNVCIKYFLLNSVLASADTILDDKNASSLGSIILLLGIYVSSNSLVKEITASTDGWDTAEIGCNSALGITENLKTKIKTTNEAIIKLLQDKINVDESKKQNYATPEKHNFNMFINLGLADEDGKNYNNKEIVGKIILDFFSQMNFSDDVERQIRELGKEPIQDCSIYNNNKYDKIDFIAAFYSQLMNPNSNIFINWMFCTIFEIDNPFINNNMLSWQWYLSFLYSISTSSSYNNLKNKCITPFLLLLIKNEDLRKYIFTQLFGNPSYKITQYNQINKNEININVARDALDKAFEKFSGLIESCNNKCSNKVIEDICNEEIYKPFEGLFYNFNFNVIRNYPKLNFKSYNEYLMNCNQPPCDKKIIKKNIIDALCEMLYKKTQNDNFDDNMIFTDELKTILWKGIDERFEEFKKIFINNDNKCNYEESDITSIKEEDFDEIVNQLIENINNNNFKQNLYNIKIKELNENTNLTPNERKNANNEWVQGYFIKFYEILTSYKDAVNYGQIQEEQKKFILEIINEKENPLIEGLLNMIINKFPDEAKKPTISNYAKNLMIGSMIEGIYNPCDYGYKAIYLKHDVYNKNYKCFKIDDSYKMDAMEKEYRGNYNKKLIELYDENKNLISPLGRILNYLFKYKKGQYYPVDSDKNPKPSEDFTEDDLINIKNIISNITKEIKPTTDEEIKEKDEMVEFVNTLTLAKIKEVSNLQAKQVDYENYEKEFLIDNLNENITKCEEKNNDDKCKKLIFLYLKLIGIKDEDFLINLLKQLEHDQISLIFIPEYLNIDKEITNKINQLFNNNNNIKQKLKELLSIYIYEKQKNTIYDINKNWHVLLNADIGRKKSIENTPTIVPVEDIITTEDFFDIKDENGNTIDIYDKIDKIVNALIVKKDNELVQMRRGNFDTSFIKISPVIYDEANITFGYKDSIVNEIIDDTFKNINIDETIIRIIKNKINENIKVGDNRLEQPLKIPKEYIEKQVKNLRDIDQRDIIDSNPSRYIFDKFIDKFIVIVKEKILTDVKKSIDEKKQNIIREINTKVGYAVIPTEKGSYGLVKISENDHHKWWDLQNKNGLKGVGFKELPYENTDLLVNGNDYNYKANLNDNTIENNLPHILEFHKGEENVEPYNPFYHKIIEEKTLDSNKWVELIRDKYYKRFSFSEKIFENDSSPAIYKQREIYILQSDLDVLNNQINEFKEEEYAEKIIDAMKKKEQVIDNLKPGKIMTDDEWENGDFFISDEKLDEMIAYLTNIRDSGTDEAKKILKESILVMMSEIDSFNFLYKLPLGILGLLSIDLTSVASLFITELIKFLESFKSRDQDYFSEIITQKIIKKLYFIFFTNEISSYEFQEKKQEFNEQIGIKFDYLGKQKLKGITNKLFINILSEDQIKKLKENDKLSLEEIREILRPYLKNILCNNNKNETTNIYISYIEFFKWQLDSTNSNVNTTSDNVSIVNNNSNNDSNNDCDVNVEINLNYIINHLLTISYNYKRFGVKNHTGGLQLIVNENKFKIGETNSNDNILTDTELTKLMPQ